MFRFNLELLESLCMMQQGHYFGTHVSLRHFASISPSTSVSNIASQTRFTPSFRVLAARDPLAKLNDPLLIIKPQKKLLSPLAVVRNRARVYTQFAIKKVLRTSKPGYYFVVTPNLCSVLMAPQTLSQEFASILCDMDLHTSETHKFVRNVKCIMKCGRKAVPAVDGIAIALLARAKEDGIEEEMSSLFKKMLQELMTDHNLFEVVCCPTLADSTTLNEKKKAFAALTSRIAFNAHIERMIKLVLRLHRPHLVDIALAYLTFAKEMSDFTPKPDVVLDLEYTKFLVDAILNQPSDD